MIPNLAQHLRRSLLEPLEQDIRSHAKADEATAAHLRTEHQRARNAARTAHDFSTWREEQITLSAVAWILGCVFVRFAEDNGLIREPRLAGADERLALAQDATTNYFAQNPSHSDREYLLWVFEKARELPGMSGLFDPDHNPLYRIGPSVDGADLLLEFWRSLDPQSGELALSFESPERDTRFLGDLYQDLSEDAKKRYALLQTPEFIEEFILERTLEPAIAEFGLAATDLIDPACGSGHFLLGAFDRLLGHWHAREPETSTRALCQRVLDQITGVDVNPFAVAIAEFRLLVAALKASEVEELAKAPDFKFNLTTGDSLLHGQRPGRLAGMERASARTEHQHLYEVEDEAKLRELLDRRYAAVVANPPYITPKDPASRDAYREIYSSCSGKYALSVPFMELLHYLARAEEGRSPAGFIGQITSNSFMKREFGKKLIEGFLPRWDLTHVIDTKAVAIPGHGTPTLILLGRARGPVGETVRGVLGIRGEELASAGKEPGGAVWTEITSLWDQPGVEAEFVSVEELQRSALAEHPWSLQGGGARDVNQLMDRAVDQLAERADGPGGFGGVSGIDDVAIGTKASHQRRGIEADLVRPLIQGDLVRDWEVRTPEWTYFPYLDEELIDIRAAPGAAEALWAYRTTLESRPTFSGSSYKEEGRSWWGWHQVAHRRYRTSLSITWSEVATHNHFVLDRGGRVFKQTAPVIKLNAEENEPAHLGLLSLLNSAAACFWMKQAFHNKGAGGGASRGEPYQDFFQFNSTKLQRFPLPSDPPLELARRLDRTAQELAATLPSVLLETEEPSVELLASGKSRWASLRKRMIALQEELDWRCYTLYGLTDLDLTYPDLDALPEIDLGERAFELVLARKLASGQTETQWFQRHGSEPQVQIPERLPADYVALLERRLTAIEDNKAIGLIERPEYKRRWAVEGASRGRGWQTEGWAAMEQAALREWICARLESEETIWQEPPTLLRADQISDLLLGDRGFQEALSLFAGDVDPGKLVAKLLAEESVPYLAALYLKPSGLRKRAVWEQVWELQRAEDRGESVEIDPPPRYSSADFRKATFWRQRGKLDVPKERFISYPGAASDGSDLYGWTDWDHAQRAQALAGRIAVAFDQEGKGEEVVRPLLDGLDELLPWVRQWHAEVDPTYGQPLGEIYAAFSEERRARLG